MTPEKQSKLGYSPMQYVHIAITIFFMVVFGFLPPFGTLTPVGMKILGLFVGVVYAYSTLEIIWPSILAIVLYGLSGMVDSVDDAALAMMGNSVVFQTIVQQMAAGAIVIYGFGKWFARKTLSLKMFHGRPLLYTWCFLFIFMWANIVLETIPIMIMLCSIWADIGESCDYEKNDNFYYWGFGGIILTLMLGISMMPYRSWQLGLAKTWANVSGTPINLGSMFIRTAIMGVIIITVYVVLGAKLFRVDLSHMREFDVEKLGEESKRLRPRTKRIVIIYLFFMLVTIFAGTFTKSAFAVYVNNVVTSGGLFAVCLVLLMVVPSGEGDGKPCIVFSEIKNSESAVSWPVIFMCAATIPLASALTKEATGITPWLTEILTPVFAGRSPIFILVAAIIAMLILTNIGSNIATATALIPIIAPFALATGAEISIFGMAIIYSANMGLVLPGSSAPAAVWHARSEIPQMKKRVTVILFAVALHMIAQIVIYSASLLIAG